MQFNTTYRYLNPSNDIITTNREPTIIMARLSSARHIGKGESYADK